VVLWSAAAASVASDRMRKHTNSALAGQAFFLVLQGSAEELSVNMHAVHNFTVVMS